MALTLSAVILSACSTDGSSGSCVELREPQDPQSGLHVIDPEGLTYTTDPPTSGPHAGGPAASGVFDEPLLAAVQVRVLESGGAMIQYDDTVSPTAIDELTSLVSGAVALAPTDSNLPSPIVATAWTWKLTCDVVDLDRIEAFIIDRPQDAPGVD
jgi:hypothetical protein